MSTRTPPIQPRSQFSRDWGNYANSFTALPNQSGNALGSDFFSILEAGDTAYVTEDRLRARCVDPGTLGGGDAEWRLEGAHGGVLLPDFATVVAGANVATQTLIGVNLSVFGGGAVARAFTPASAVYLERQLRAAFASPIAANDAAGQTLAQAQFALAMPRQFVGRAAILGTAVTTGRFVYGLVSTIGRQFFGATEPSTLLSCVFVGADSGDANLQLMHNDGAGTCTKINLGAAFARAANLTFQLRLRISAGQVRYEVRRLDAAGFAVGVIAANIPADTQTLTWCWQATTDASGANSAELATLGFTTAMLEA